LDGRVHLGTSARGMASADCIFCKIATGAIPSKRVFEDDLVFAIRDIRPQAPTHILVIPKEHIASLWELEDERLAGRLMHVAAKIAREEGLDGGWRLIANSRDHAGQEVAHLHLHVLGGRALGRMLAPAKG
jgi:histidine triad (HIT) family protein